MALQRTVHLVGKDVHQFAVHEFIFIRDMQHFDGRQLYVAIELADLGAVVGFHHQYKLGPMQVVRVQFAFAFGAEASRTDGKAAIVLKKMLGRAAAFLVLSANDKDGGAGGQSVGIGMR